MAMLMRPLIAALLMTSTLSSLALADKPVDPHEPIPGKADPRIRTFPYDANNTMRLTTPGLNPVRVVFGDGEIPGAIAGSLVSLGDGPSHPPTDWFVKGAGNTLLVQPLHDDMPVSLIFVTTTKDGQSKNYVIELRVGAGDLSNPADKTAYGQVSYTYPEVQSADAMEARARAARALVEGKARTSLTQARFSAPRQWHYSKQGADCVTMTPSGWNWISDDNNQTAMIFPPHMDGVSYYSRESDDDKNELLITPIPTTTRVGTLIVLPGVYRQIVLRHGNKVCAVRNDFYDAIGVQPGGGSGTISPDVIRVRAKGK